MCKWTRAVQTCVVWGSTVVWPHEPPERVSGTPGGPWTTLKTTSLEQILLPKRHSVRFFNELIPKCLPDGASTFYSCSWSLTLFPCPVLQKMWHVLALVLLFLWQVSLWTAECPPKSSNFWTPWKGQSALRWRSSSWMMLRSCWKVSILGLGFTCGNWVVITSKDTGRCTPSVGYCCALAQYSDVLCWQLLWLLCVMVNSALRVTADIIWTGGKFIARS